MINNNYFELRNVNPATYSEYEVPAYLKDVLTNNQANILDFGCGFGQLTVALLGSGYQNVEGADINFVAIKSLQERGLIVHDLNSSTVFFESHVNSYDIVIVSHVLEHLPKDQIISKLSLLRNLLKTTGQIIVMVPNAQSNTGAYWAYEDFTHNTLFTTGSIYYVLKAAGFSDVSFLDADGLAGMSGIKRLVKKFLLSLYQVNYRFWNKVTSSSFHRPSPQIFSYELKVMATK